jgi:hypothetical protein
MSVPGSLPPGQAGEVRAIFAVDIAGYTRRERDSEIRLHLREATYEMLQQAFTGSGIPWEDCDYTDRGDGALILLPPALPAASLAGPVPGQLRHLIGRHNRICCEAARLQLRATASIGLVYHDQHGIAGDEATFVCRMLEARPLRQALADGTAVLALMISRYMHDTLVRADPSLAGPGRFREVRTRVKQMPIRAWLETPDTANGTRTP